MTVFAHRGYSGAYPENTMLAFRMAVEDGCDGIELDVHLTADGVPVIIHDETVDRTTDGSGPVLRYTYRELRKLSAAGERIPSLEEYCEWAAGENLTTNMELKTDNVWYPGIEKKVWDCITRYGLEKRVLISSFNHISLLRMREITPETPMGALVQPSGMVRVRPGAYCAENGFQAWHPAFAAMDEDNVRDCTARGIRLNVYVINDFSALERVFRWGCDGIFTNYPGVMKRRLAALRQEAIPCPAAS